MRPLGSDEVAVDDPEATQTCALERAQETQKGQQRIFRSHVLDQLALRQGELMPQPLGSLPQSRIREPMWKLSLGIGR